MLDQLRDAGSSSEERTLDPSGREDASTVVFDASAFQLGRALFGGILAFLAIDNLRNLEERVQYAEAKGAPAPDLTVPGVSTGLLLGSVGLALWRLPRASATAVAGFFLGVTPMMHDFWNAEDEAEQQQEIIQFMKNGALLGAALVFLQLGRERDE